MEKTLQLIEKDKEYYKINHYELALINTLAYLMKCEDEKIFVLLRNRADIVPFHKDLKKIGKPYGIKVKNSKPGSFTLEFKNTKNVIRFFTLDSLIKIHPTDANINPDLKAIVYLNTMPDDFYKECIFVKDLNVCLDKYANFIGNFERIKSPSNMISFDKVMFSSNSVKPSLNKPQYIGEIQL